MATIYGTNNDFQVPSLDLRFADRKNFIDTISGTDLVTFTRASSGTYVDGDGVIQSAATNAARFDHDPVTNESLGLLVEEGRTNLVTYSDQVINGLYVYGLTVIPFANFDPGASIRGTLLRETASGSSHMLELNSSIENRTFSVFVKAAGRTKFRVFAYTSNLYASFSLAGSGSVISTNNGTATIEPFSDGWYRCSVYCSVASGTSIYFGPIADFIDPTYPGGFSSTYLGDGVSGIYVWGAQVEAGSFPTSYIPTPATFTSRASTATYYNASGVIQTAAIDVARDNAYFPDENGVFKPAGLLLEGSGTNYITNSGQLETKSGQNIAIASSGELAPDQTSTAALLTEDTSNGFHLLGLIGTTTFTPNATLSSTIYAKNESVRYIGLSISDGFVNIYDKVFDLQDGAILTGTYSTPVSASIKALPNGWYECSITATVTGYSTANAGIYLARTQGWNYLGDGSSGAYIWGAQLEASPYPTSYIPTAGSTVTRAADISSSSTVTRAADVVSITGSNFSSWYNQSEGAFLSQLSRLGSPNTGSIGAIIGGSNPNTTSSSYHVLIGNGNAQILSSGGASYSFGLSSTGVHKLVNAYKLNDFNAAYDGNLLTADTSYTPPTCTQLVFAGVFPITNNTGHISRLTYFPTRLSNSLLQKLTK